METNQNISHKVFVNIDFSQISFKTYKIQRKEITNMTWYFNFCAPTMSNDATINFHRQFQTAELMTLMIIFAVYHTYYRMCGTEPLSQTQQQRQSNESQSKSQNKSSEDNNSIKSQSQDNKSVSIAQKLRSVGSQNQSYIQFKGSGKKFLKKRKFQIKNSKPAKVINIKQNVTVHEIEEYFPIVFGHHAIAMGASIMYSPYAQQSIASILYVIFCFVLAMVNSRRMRRITFAVWIFMAFINVFIMMSALLEVGQSNWDFINNLCFAEQYVSLY